MCAMLDVSEYETPAQYEKRTKKKLSDNAAVWFKRDDGKTFIDGGYWGICRYARFLKGSMTNERKRLDRTGQRE